MQGISGGAAEPRQPMLPQKQKELVNDSQELFEGMKAYRGVDTNVRLFRPMLNMTRMAMSARRSCLPEFEPAELLSCIAQLVHMDQEWVPWKPASQYGQTEP